MSIEQYIEELSAATRHGWGFLAAYGVTWLACWWAWSKWSERTAAYFTLFQGMVALPLALALTSATSGPARPMLPGMDYLSVLLASGQLLGLPIVIYLVSKSSFTSVPLAMVLLLVVHFAPYSWLYATPLYLVMGATLSIAAVVATSTAGRGERESRDEGVAGAGRVCLTTGVGMLISSGVALTL